ncbi:SRPBCC family protein [Demequina sp. NBRC 110053]|uniref:SRPBCC family protein n=1 Tax=Demequina sp. NBRC 110053 TaxID=1570342 RepID=UPI0009FFAD66|nr:SRPBCC family protein [Demequina sp. NBRC 110053]
MSSTSTLVTESSVAADALFEASLDIDAHVASLAHSGEKAIAGVTSGQISLGESVTWRARHCGVWFTMTSQVTEVEAPVRFVDQQVAGPFKAFIHEHSFEQRGEGSRMTDVITVSSPFFGRLAERVVLVPYLRRLIAKRNAHLIAMHSLSN